MYCFEIREFIVVCIDTDTKEKACITTIHNLVVAELSTLSKAVETTNRTAHAYLDKVGLILLIPGCYQSMHFSPKAHLFLPSQLYLTGVVKPSADLLVIIVRHIPLGKTGLPLSILQMRYDLSVLRVIQGGRRTDLHQDEPDHGGC